MMCDVDKYSFRKFPALHPDLVFWSLAQKILEDLENRKKEIGFKTIQEILGPPWITFSGDHLLRATLPKCYQYNIFFGILEIWKIQKCIVFVTHLEGGAQKVVPGRTDAPPLQMYW